jgi:uncharacterized membrane protein
MGKKKKRKETFKESLKDNSTKEGTKGSSSKGLSIGIVAGVLIAAAVAFILFGGGPSSGFKIVKAEAGIVKIPVSDVNDGHAHFYSYNGSRKINFFVLRSSDGVIRAAFDACDVCYSSKKGYRQEGDVMVCNNCGQRFPSTKINVLKGGCNPAPLDRKVDGGYLLLRPQDIETGAFYF